MGLPRPLTALTTAKVANGCPVEAEMTAEGKHALASEFTDRESCMTGSDGQPDGANVPAPSLPTGPGTGSPGPSRTRAAPAKAAKGPARRRHLHLTPDVWRQARHLYEDEGCKPDEIAERFGVTPPTVIRRIRVEGWVRQEHLRALMETGDTRGLARMVARLIAAFDAQVRAVEAQFHSGTGKGGQAEALASDPAVVERNARTLGSLAKTLDILLELRGGLSADDTRTERDADVVRRDLQKRLERLCREAPVAAVPGRPRPGGTGVPAS